MFVLNFNISSFLRSFLNASRCLLTLFIINQTYIIQVNRVMNSLLNYEILINLKSMNILCIRQSSFYQIRLTVYQVDNKNNNVFAVPFLMLKSQIQTPSKSSKAYDVNNTAQIDHGNNTFLTRKFIVRNIDEKVQINEMCIFKGCFLTNNGDDINNQIKIYVELLSYQQNDIEIVQEWTGSTLKHIGNTYCPIYFNSYKFTCNINSTVHLIISSLSLQNLALKDSESNSNHSSFYKKNSAFLEESLQMLKRQIKALKANLPKVPFQDQYQCSPSTYRYISFNPKKTNKQLKEAELKDIESQINSLSQEDALDKIKYALNLLNQAVYQFWKKYQIILTKWYSQTYQKAIKSQYYSKLQQHHQQNSLLLEETGLAWQTDKTDDLFIYPFDNHQTFLKLKKKDVDMIKQQKKSFNKKIQLLILVHGYQASSFDMEPISNYLKYKNTNILCLLSTVNQGKTQQEIEQSAHRLAIQIKNYINSLQLKDFQINFICHSLGGIIGRACLKYLQLHKDKFNQFVSLCSPHLGYLYHSSTLISTSLWILNKVKKDPSMIELTLEDNNQLQKTYIYQISRNKELNWFKKIWLFGSKEDQYVPYWSAVLEDKYFYFETSSSKIYKSMLQNLTKDIEQKIIRCEIIFNQKAKDLSNFIGRTAHIKILNFIPGLQLLSSVFTP